jgi:hypothetical protein
MSDVRGDVMEVLGRYVDALRSQDWGALADCLAPNVYRSGPYLDVVEGRAAYVAFLSGVIPTLPNYDIQITRIDVLEGGAALVRLSEFVDVKGVRSEFPEALVFEFDAEGAIARVDIYLKQVAGPRD